MQFEWDEVKNRSNIHKHGIDFNDAVDIFNHPVLTAAHRREDFGEDRWIALGWMKLSVAVVVYAGRSGDTSEMPELGDDFFQRAELHTPPKQAVAMRLDANVLAWFKEQGQGYQTRINKLLLRLHAGAAEAAIVGPRAAHRL